MNQESRERLTQAFSQSLLLGQHYSSITQARAQAQDVLSVAIRPGDTWVKVVDECMEAAVVRVAGAIVQGSETTHQAYNRLVELLEQQPNLGVRTSTSVMQQAYSTPIPIAFLAASLAKITSETTVYEPTAGNGALLINADPRLVIANELNGDRATELGFRGFGTLTQQNAMTYRPPEKVDRVIANPPFGTIADQNGDSQKFRIYQTWTTQIDQVIAFNALEFMKADGKAVLILGGKLGRTDEARSTRYHSRESRAFFKQLYDRYNVIDHFSIDGGLYRKQGAGFPIDLIVINGQGQSDRRLPAADVPEIFTSFTALKEKLPNVSLSRLSPSVDADRDDSFFTIKVPLEVISLTLKSYLELMEQRLAWMMSQDSADDAQAYLRRTLHRVCPAQQIPIPDQEDWKSEWAMTIVHYTEAFYNRNEIHPDVFPATPIETQHPDYQTQLDNHNEMTLDDWLSHL